MPVVRSSAVGGRVEAREQQLGELAAGHPAYRLVGVDQPLVDHRPGDPERRLGGALADPGLQDPQPAAPRW